MFNQVPQVDVAEAQRMLSGGAMLVDVRRPDEWDAGHASTAQHVPLDQLPARIDDLPDADRVVVICRSGSRSARATLWLRHHGYDAVNLDGGMQAWERAGATVIRDDGTAGRVA